MRLPCSRAAELARLTLLAAFISVSAVIAVGLPQNVRADESDKIALPAAVDRKVDFEADIRPIFAASCTKCHGDKKQEAGLRLDQRDGALKGGDNGVAILPGKSGDSLLVHAVAGASDLVGQMPEKGEPLSAEQIGLIRAWIDQGAEWPQTTSVDDSKMRDHWAFKAPARPDVPQIKHDDWPRTPIDAFIAARLESEGLQPSPEADRATLLRRLSLDLIGLPPTIAELDAFLADQSPDAYQKQVERLLASPHYGERWGRHWLDAARYADSDGFEKDKSRSVWPYRDYVINALNRDLPYDQFLIEQLAGDQLPGATQDQIVATGFLRHSMVNEEGGVDPEQFRMEAMFDRMDAIGKGMLGLTIQCAQCHTHKFDPITHEDYYRLFAFLNNDYEPQRVVYTPSELMQCESLSRQMREIDARLQHEKADWAERMAEWEAQATQRRTQWTVLAPDEYSEPGGGAKLSLLKDNSMLCAGYAPTKCEYRVVAKALSGEITAIRLETLLHPNLPCGGPGRAFKGTFALSEINVEAAPINEPDKKQEVKIASATADYEQPESPLEANFDDRSKKTRTVGPVKFAFDGSNETGWAIDAGPGRRNQDRQAVFVFAEPIRFESGAVITVTLRQHHGGWNSDDHQNNLIGRFRLAVTSAASPTADPVPSRVRETLNMPREQRGPQQIAEAFAYWRTTVGEWGEANNQVESLWKQWPEGSTTLALATREEPRETSILKRGDFLKPVKPVASGVPAFMHSLPEGAPPTRLTFAKWVADRRSPTTARVFVNRVWQSYFGTGIVATSEDFGVQSEAPSHPELLDWLAVQFMEEGWSIKALHRLIVNSSTYRQSSHVSPELFARDQYNRLLARGPRLRVEGEIVRDVALAASGLLSTKIGGPSVMPPAPAFLFLPPASYAPFPWVEATGEDRYRRALYTFRRRSTPYPMLANFDVPNADLSCVRRPRSNTPMQALTTLNETLFVESAQALAKRLLAEGGSTDEDRVRYGFRLCTSRVPTDDERQEIVALIQKQQLRLADNVALSWKVATGKEEAGQLPAGASPQQLAAYTVAARVLLNLDETITKE